MKPKKLKSNGTVTLHERFRTTGLLEYGNVLVKKETLGRISKVTDNEFEFTEVFRGFKFKFKNSELSKYLKEV